MVSLVLAHALAILLAGGLRFGPSAVLPGAARPVWLASMAAVAAALAVALVRDVRRGRAPWAAFDRFVVWLAFPGAAALHWSLGHPDADPGADLPALALVLGLVLAVLAMHSRAWLGRESSARAWTTAARWLLVPTALVGVGAWWVGGRPAALPVPFLTYPLYALAQLFAVLVLPWIVFGRDGASPRRRVLLVTVLFGLVHWPNPFATAATLAGMAVWASAWRAGSALLPVALSMGLAAAAITQWLPEDLTGHMRVGANYVLKQREHARDSWLDTESRRISREVGPVGEEGLQAWLARALPLATGAPVDSTLVTATADFLERLHRESTLRWIFDSGEFRYRNGITARLDATELRFFDSTFVPFHPAHAPYTGLVARGETLSYREFVDLAYHELLGRSPREPEYRHWPAPIPLGLRVEFLRRVLDGGGIDDGDLRRWREPDDPELRERFRERREAIARGADPRRR